MQQHRSKLFACRPPPPPTLRMGSVDPNLSFSEHGHVAYQIKENQEAECKYFADSHPYPPSRS